ncbi:hypothetical protein BGW36DRAFT_150337 [Talaromyces proteolyticus]|uniref:Uncharacterized protein n=1 Tax=Talaromyces proteolyticus TaxID=1131652 RepID=A0AAD4KRE8_9EURO|nr:uncharacterized protein BGW36DRAFT_150337 [Talaromyces proteolyticus]KAH8698765.1 hypothetical protein BGW36DRAFT_150337 [Talaromyces proteolyticus]
MTKMKRRMKREMQTKMKSARRRGSAAKINSRSEKLRRSWLPSPPQQAAAARSDVEYPARRASLRAVLFPALLISSCSRPLLLPIQLGDGNGNGMPLELHAAISRDNPPFSRASAPIGNLVPTSREFSHLGASLARFQKKQLNRPEDAVLVLVTPGAGYRH